MAQWEKQNIVIHGLLADVPSSTPGISYFSLMFIKNVTH